MKKQIALFSLFLFLISNATDAQVRFGARGSLSISNQTKAHSISKSRTGYQVGVIGLIPLDYNDKWYFSPEVNYSAQGEFNVHEPKKANDYPEKKDIKTFTNFLNIPLLVRNYFSSSESEFFVEGGPYIGFKLGEDVERIENTEPFDEEFKSFDFGLGLGIGYSLNRQLEASVRYFYGFPDQIKYDASNDKNHNSILNFGVSYFFN